MTLLKDNNYKEINVALLSLEADIKNKISGFDTSAIDKQLDEINSRIDKINAGDNNTSAVINDIRYEIEDINSKLNANSTKIENIEQKLSDIFSAENKVTDFNTTTDAGIYYWVTDAANKPVTEYGVLLVNKYDGVDSTSNLWINQIAYGTNNKIYFRQKINDTNWTEWKALAFDGETTAYKVANALTVNGKTYDGSEAVDTGVQTVANGGTGVTTQADINKAFIGNLDTGNSDVTDGTEFVSSYASDNGFADSNAVNKPYKRKFSAVWNYIKGKISSVLGLTASSYGGKAATAGTADKIEPNYTKSLALTTVTSTTTKYIHLADCGYGQAGTLQVFLSGDSFKDTVAINFGGGNGADPMLCGHYSGNNHRVLSAIVQKGSAWNSNYSIYLKINQATTCTVKVALLKGNCTINITESTTAPTNISEWPISDGFFGDLTGKSTKSSFLDEYPGAGSKRLTSGNIKPKDASEYGGMRKDVVTDSMTDSGRPNKDGHLLTMFWDNSGRYDSQFFVSNSTPLVLKSRSKANTADYGPWVDIITSNNIGDQTVATAKTARTAADTGFLCKLYQLSSATSDNTVQANNVILLGKIPDPASTEAPATPRASWDIDVDFYFVRSQGHKAAWCNVKAGYGYSNAWRKYGLIETFGVDINSNYRNPFYLVTLKYNNEYYIGVRHLIDMDGSYAARVKNVNTGGSRNPSTVNNTPLVNMLKVIPYQKTTDGTVINNEIKTSIADFPNTYAPAVERNGDLVLKSGYVKIGASGVAGSKLTIQGGTENSNSYTDTNPKLEFKNNDGSQNISLTFTDYDAVQAPASLTLNGNQGNEYFIAPNIKATTNFIGNLKGTANKVANKLTINGQSFDGSSPLDINIYGAYDHIVHDGDSLLEWANCTDGSMKKVLIKSGTYNITKSVNLSQAGTGYVLAEQGAVINSHVPIAFTASSGKTVIHNLKVVCDGASNGDNTCAFSANNPESLILYDCSATYRTYTEIVNRNLFVSCTCYNCSYAFQNLPANSFISMKVFYQCRCYNCKCLQTIAANSSTGIIFDSESYFYKECHCASCDAELTTSRNIKAATTFFACYYNCWDRCVGCLSKINVSSKALTVYSTLYGFLRCQYMSSCKETHTEGYSNIKGIVQCDFISSTTGINGGSNTHFGNSCDIK